MKLSRGTTLVELMVTIVIVGIFSGAMLSLVTKSQSRSVISGEKQIILDAVQDELDQSAIEGSKGTLTAGARGVVRTLPLSYPVTINRTVTAIALKYRLFNVSVTATWDDGSNARRGQIKMATRVFNEP